MAMLFMNLIHAEMWETWCKHVCPANHATMEVVRAVQRLHQIVVWLLVRLLLMVQHMRLIVRVM